MLVEFHGYEDSKSYIRVRLRANGTNLSVVIGLDRFNAFLKEWHDAGDPAEIEYDSETGNIALPNHESETDG
jgi:hypothetical protein